MNRDVKLIWEAYQPTPEQIMDDMFADLDPIGDGTSGGVVHFKNGFSWEYSLSGGGDSNLEVQYELKDPGRNTVHASTYILYKPRSAPITFDAKESAVAAMKSWQKKRRVRDLGNEIENIKKILVSEDWLENWLEATVDGHDATWYENASDKGNPYSSLRIEDVSTSGAVFYGVLDSPSFNTRFYIKGLFSFDPGGPSSYDFPEESPRYYFEMEEVKSSTPLPPSARQYFEIGWEDQEDYSKENIERAVSNVVGAYMYDVADELDIPEPDHDY